MVSVIIPVYNVESYLPRCLDCIARQTYRDLEIILVDDGSTDRSGDICEEYASNDSRTRVIHQPNSGLWAARNTGHDAAHGEYLFFPDADDYFNFDIIRILLDAINSGNGYDLAICRMTKTDGDDVYLPTPAKIQLTEKNRDELFRNLFSESTEDPFSIFMWNKLFRSSAVKDLRSNQYERTQDKDFMIRLFLRTDKAILVENRLYYWFQRPDSLIHSADNLYLHYKCRSLICYRNYMSLPEDGKCYEHYLLDELYNKMLFWRESSWDKPGREAVFSECRKILKDTRRAYRTCREIPFCKRLTYLLLSDFPAFTHLLMKLSCNSAA